MKIPASSHQERLWFIDRFENGYLYESSPIYHNIPLIININGLLDIEILEKSIQDVINRHEALRTQIVTIEDKPYQWVNKTVNFSLSILDLTRGGHTGGYERAISCAFEEINQPFLLHKGPLIRGKLIQFESRQFILVITTHHIIADRYSINILLEEIFLYYKGYLKKQPLKLPDLSIHYADFSQWQRSLSVKLMESLLSYWKSKLSDKLQALELPLDRPRALVHTYQGKWQSISFPKGLCDRIKAFSKQEKTSNFITLLAAFKVLLYKYTHHDEIVVGINAENRSQPGLEKIIGSISNLLVIRDYLSEELPFREFISEVDKTVKDAYKHQYMPFDKLASEINPDKDMSRTVFFDVLFQYEDTFHPIPPVENLKITTVETNLGWGKYDLSILIQDKRESFAGILVYNSNFFNESTIFRMIGHYLVLLKRILENPTREISSYSILTDREKNQLLTKWNQLKAQYPENETIHGLFAKQAARTPDDIAVKGPDFSGGMPVIASISYRQLNNKSDQLAELLRAKGVKPDTIVGILLERSLVMIVAIIGIVKAGGAYLPIEPGYPGKRITYMLDDSHTSLLLTQKELVKEIRFKGETIDLINEVEYQSAAGDLSPLNVPADAAYVIYTSGTTGEPKGAVIEHRNVARLLFNENNPFNFNNKDVWTMFHSYGFDFSVWEMYGSLLYGGKLIIISKMIAMDPTRFLQVLKKEKITVLNQTPTAFYSLMDEELKKPGGELNLRYVIFGGEALKPTKLKEWKEKYPGTQLINMYGITETTVHATYKEITDREIKSNQSNIGKPIPTLTAYVMDKNQKLLPIGIAGELCVGGKGVCRGYLNKPELTREKFVKIQYKGSELFYRSGDWVRMHKSGDLEYLGRIDCQVKIRGYRIELGEIENQLLNHSKVKEAVVLLRENPGSDKYICAYTVPDPTISLKSSELREYLNRRLPDYMLPAYFVILDHMPLTPNGKIDRKALPSPEKMTLGREVEYVAPRNRVEEILLETWEKVLGRDMIGINDNFFEIGGDSINTIQIVSRMKKAGYKLEIEDIFQNPQISVLAPLVKKVERNPDQSVITETIPLTPIQEWFFKNKVTDYHHFNQAVMLYFEEGIEEEVIKSIFSKLHEHHDALRLIYKKENGKVIQVNQGLDHPLSLQVFEFRDRKDAGNLIESKATEIQSSIDMETGPLMKLGLFHLEDGDRLLIVCHHLVIDGVSWRILLEDIETLYHQYKKGKSLTLPLKTDSFKVWSEKLSQYANSDLFLKEKTYWAELESKQIQEIKKDFEDEDNYWKDVETLSFTLNEEETHLLLTKVNVPFGTEINDILLTALVLGIKKTWGHHKVLIALEGHGRERILPDIDINRTVGWFTSMYPVILDISHHNDLSRQIKEVKETLHQIPNKGIGYGILKYLTADQYKSDVKFHLIPRLSFNYLGQFDADLEQKSFGIARESAGIPISPNARREYELDINVVTIKRQLQVSISYNKKQFKSSTIKTLLEHYHRGLSHIISYCSERQEKELTPSDLTYKKLSIEELDELKAQYLLEDIYTLSPMQEGMFFHYLYRQSSSAYFVQNTFRLHGNLDILYVEKSINQLFKRHDILRTAFIKTKAGILVQVVLKERTPDFHYEDISGKKDKNNYLIGVKANDKTQSFDPGKDVLMRLGVFKINDALYEFTWSHHHILLDGWCLGILVSEFFALYQGYLEGRKQRLPEIKQYRDYIKWLEKQDKNASQNYWLKYLEGYHETASIPIKIHHSGEVGYRKEQVNLILDAEKTVALNHMAKKNQVTLNTIFQALWGIILGIYSDKRDVVFGVVVSGRPPGIEGVESIVGLFINTIPLRIQWDKEMTVENLLTQIQQKESRGLSHHYYPLADIQKLSVLKQNLFDHLFAFENYPFQEQPIQGIEIEIPEVEEITQTNYDFIVNIIPLERLRILISYNANVYDGNLVKKILTHIKTVLGQVLESPQVKISQIDIISQEEKSLLIKKVKDKKGKFFREDAEKDLNQQEEKLEAFLNF